MRLGNIVRLKSINHKTTYYRRVFIAEKYLPKMSGLTVAVYGHSGPFKAVIILIFQPHNLMLHLGN